MPETEHRAFDVWVNDERTDPADFALFLGAGELPRVRLFAPTPAAARELRDYLLRPSTLQAVTDALFSALVELEGMDHLEAFERCR